MSRRELEFILKKHNFEIIRYGIGFAIWSNGAISIAIPAKKVYDKEDTKYLRRGIIRRIRA